MDVRVKGDGTGLAGEEASLTDRVQLDRDRVGGVAKETLEDGVQLDLEFLWRLPLGRLPFAHGSMETF